MSRHSQARGISSKRPRKFGFYLRTAMWMVLMAIGVAWLSALAFPIAIKLGLTESSASKLPNFGLLAGSALGLAVCLAQSVRQTLYFLWLIFITGFVFWFFALVLESVLVNIGNVPERKLEWLPWTALGFGFLVAGVAVFAEVYERVSAFLLRGASTRR